MICIQNKSDCYGCSACYSICLSRCIIMAKDDEGFLYPIVDQNTCINCKRCEMVCPSLNQFSPTTPLKVYAAKNKDIQIRRESSSGGIFTLLADHIIEKHNGVVFGAGIDSNNMIRHLSVEDKDKIHLLRGSKYAQSDMGDSYQEVKAYLNQGRYVLFTGTPCQVAGLKAFLQRSYKTLLCVDVVCHGSPSCDVLKYYLAGLEKEFGSRATGINFRDKKTGWKDYFFSISFENKKKYLCQKDKSAYMRGFIGNLYLRPSCYNCKVKNLKSGSDITLGDYWGVSSRFPEFDDDTGVSLVIVNTAKGYEYFNKLKDSMDIRESEITHAIKTNPYIARSAGLHRNRDLFFKRYRDESFDTLVDELLKKGNLEKLYLYIREAFLKILVFGWSIVKKLRNQMAK